MKRCIKYFFLAIWTLWCLTGIAKNYANYNYASWILVILFTLMPYFIIWFINRKSSKKNTPIKERTFTAIPTTESPVSITTSVEARPVTNVSGSLEPSAPTHTPCIKNESIVPERKELQKIQYVETENIIYRTDGKAITDAEIPYLIKAGQEATLQKRETPTAPTKFHSTYKEENLSFNFEMKYGYEVAQLTEKFESLYRNAYKTKDLNERISLLNESVKAFEKAKKFCYSKGKGGTIYFQDMWENMHNSHNQRFSYLDNIQNSLEEAKYLRDEAIPQIMNIIIKNDGILQKDVYKILPDIDKPLIQHILRQLESENKISRIKKGSSYELHMLS